MKKRINYLLRLDDACPTMDSYKWQKIEDILDKYSIKPLVAVIPNNLDKSLMIDDVDDFFWDKVFNWQKKNWALALHGFDHVYVTDQGGLNPVHKKSEFAGLSLKKQEEKIESGYSILKDKKLKIDYFVAPSHTFDENTLKALSNKTSIRKISDTISRTPYKRGEFVFLPQQFGNFRAIKLPGYWTFCLHPNTMKNSDFNVIESFIKVNKDKFISFDEIETIDLNTKNIIDNVLSFFYFFKRKFKLIRFLN
jgi:predicted deacetylase